MFFRVTVTSSTGQVATSAVSSTIASISCPDQQFPCVEQLVDNTNTNDAISLSPNPSSFSRCLKFTTSNLYYM